MGTELHRNSEALPAATVNGQGVERGGDRHFSSLLHEALRESEPPWPYVGAAIYMSLRDRYQACRALHGRSTAKNPHRNLRGPPLGAREDILLLRCQCRAIPLQELVRSGERRRVRKGELIANSRPAGTCRDRVSLNSGPFIGGDGAKPCAWHTPQGAGVGCWFGFGSSGLVEQGRTNLPCLQTRGL